MELNESEIIAQVAAGNWKNFDKLYDLYLPKIYQYVYYRTRHRQTAEDLTSTIFMKVVNNLSNFQSKGAPFGAWIYRIARNTVIDHFRTHKPVQDLETVFDLASSEDVMDETNQVINLDTIKEGIKQLNEMQQEILIMRVWEELSHREIAEILNISEENSKVTFSRAVANLKNSITVEKNL